MDLKHQSLIEWRSRGEFKELCGHSIFTLDEGGRDKPVIVLIHGFPTASWDWQAIWRALSEKYRLVSLDMLGFGFSDKPNKRNYTIHKQADLFDALIQQLEIKEYHLLAHDYGDSVAQELLARQIDSTGQGKCLSCCLLNGGLFPETHHATKMQRALLGPFGKLVNWLMGYSQFSKSFSKVFGPNSKPNEQQLSEFWELIHYNLGRHVFTNLITYMNDRIEHRERWLNALVNAPMPMAMINGSRDPVSGKHLVVRYKALNCRLDHLTELTDIGHYPQVEAPKEVSSSFLSFLDTL
ncbi:MAG: pimeloyl-ACP methyl ester carboxylesterase [Cryomorphaceae bacterium]